MSVIKNYLPSLLLLGGVVIGGTVGAVMGPKAAVIKPVGDLFLNLIFVLVVPLVFFSIASSLTTLKRTRMIGKVLGVTLAVFVVMSAVVGVFSYWGFELLCSFDGLEKFESSLSFVDEKLSVGDTIVNLFTVTDFHLLLSRKNLLPLVVFSAIFGLAAGSINNSRVTEFLQAGLDIIMKMMTKIMSLAPIGLGCYFATTIGNLGADIVGDYLEIFLVFCVLSVVVFFAVHSLYIIIVGGSLKDFWSNITVPSVTAIATCSSAACMPVNIDSLKKMGVSSEIAESVIPFGTNLHKGGTIMATVAKVLFTFSIIGGYSASFGNMWIAIGVAVLSSIVVSAIPTGGMVIELMVCSVLGIDPSFAATLMIIATIVDVPATLVNSTANVTATYVVDKLLKKRI